MAPSSFDLVVSFHLSVSKSKFSAASPARFTLAQLQTCERNAARHRRPDLPPILPLLQQQTPLARKTRALRSEGDWKTHAHTDTPPHATASSPFLAEEILEVDPPVTPDSTAALNLSPSTPSAAGRRSPRRWGCSAAPRRAAPPSEEEDQKSRRRGGPGWCCGSSRRSPPTSSASGAPTASRSASSAASSRPTAPGSGTSSTGESISSPPPSPPRSPTPCRDVRFGKSVSIAFDLIRGETCEMPSIRGKIEQLGR